MRADASARYLSEVQVAEMTCRSLSTLRNERSKGRGIPYVKIGRSVRYELADVIRFMDAHKVETECFVMNKPLLIAETKKGGM